MLNLQIFKDASDVATSAADHIIQEWKRAVAGRDQFVAGLATGSTPIECYHHLVARYRDGTLSEDDVQHAVTANLDEYLPRLDRRAWCYHEQSYLRFMYAHLFAHLPFLPGSNWLPDPAADDLEAECRTYEARIREVGGIDLQLLGLGTNGHVGFAEPGGPAAHPDARTQVVNLTPQTVKDNAAKFFADRHDEVPKQAISMGLGTILHAKKILMLATGPAKATAVGAAVLGPVTRFCPASFLQNHAACTWMVDEDAATVLIGDLRHAADWFGGVPKPGTYELRSEAGIQHRVSIDESICVSEAAENEVEVGTF